MMRVEINIDESVRGLVSKYASEKSVTMPEAYGELVINGLAVSDVEFPTFSPDVPIDDELIEASNMDSDEYEIELENSE